MRLSKLEGKGWFAVEPPEPQDEDSVVARYNGEPVKAGFLTERVKDAEDEVYYRYRSGAFDLDVKIDFLIGQGQIRVQRAEGYSNGKAASDD